MTTAAARSVAFYAPMKSPLHPVPSGDREMARNLMDVIGPGVQLVSELRIYDKHGDPALQADLRTQAAETTAKLIRSLPELDLWVTYHNYYKAPDLIGPLVSKARGIPYVQIESTRATSRLNGPWAGFAASAHEAADAADAIFYLSENDHLTLHRDRHQDQALVPFPPFLPQAACPAAADLQGPMLAVGMMRAGDKLASYRIIAETLQHLTGDWQLQIAGDGPAGAEVAEMMRPFGDRVTFLGQLDRDGLQRAYARSSLFLWPGVNEAFGMVYLEAQSHGLPVVAQDRPGMRDILRSQNLCPVEAGAAGLAQILTKLLADPDLRRTLGAAGRDCMAQHHLAPAARSRFWAAVTPLLRTSP